MSDILQPPTVNVANGSLGKYPSWATTLLGIIGAVCTASVLAVPWPWVLIPVGIGGALSAVLGYNVPGPAVK